MPRKYTKRYAQLKLYENIKAILESNTLREAYLKTHPKSSFKSAGSNAFRMITPELFQELKRLLELEKIAETSRETIEKLIFIVFARWANREERTSDMLTALNILTKLIPDFKERFGIEDISQLSEQEIDERLKRFNVKPDFTTN